MDLKEYRRQGYKMIDYIANYLENVRHLRVYPDVKPGYMQALLPDHAPEDGENFDKIFKDFETIVMPGVCHWQSPHMHGYFPSLTSPASLLGDMLSDGLSCLGFTWAASPASTELEVIVMDWLAKLVGLPDFFLHSGPGKGGGVIQTTASEGTLIALLAARTRMFQYYKEKYNNVNERELNTRLVGYTSDQAHSSVEKAGLIGLVHMRYIGTKDDLSMDGEKLLEAIRKDRELGLIPFFVCASLGTTGAGCFDHLEEIGPICAKENLFMHVDAAYAGCAFVCPEFRFLMEGVEYADSFLFNPAKWLLVNFDCSCFWVKNSEYLHRTFNVNPLYLKHDNIGLAVDFNHWQISLSRRFRALKIWMTLRNFGAKGLQKHIRHGINLGKYLETLVLEDERFEIPATRYMGLLVFRIKGENELTEALLKKINVGGRIHCVPYSVKGKYVIRFVITSPETTYQDIKDDWGFIQKKCNQLLNGPSSGRRLSEAEIKEKNPCFGTSLLLSDSPFSPKVINASFVALLEAGDTLKEFLDKNGVLSIACKDSPYLQRRLKDLVRGERKYSLDSHIDLIVAVNSSKEKKKTIKNGTDSTEEDSEEVPNKNCCRMCGQMIPYHMQNHIESVS